LAPSPVPQGKSFIFFVVTAWFSCCTLDHHRLLSTCITASYKMN
jgi:hypothetical protein